MEVLMVCEGDRNVHENTREGRRPIKMDMDYMESTRASPLPAGTSPLSLDETHVEVDP